MVERMCQCGTPMTYTGILAQCPHCERPCKLDIEKRTCAACMNYGAAINLRVIAEHMAERKGKRPGE